MYLYVDVFMIVNMIMNTAILWLVARVSQTHYHWWRIGVVALFASLYSLGFGIMSLRMIYHPFVKLMIPVLIILAAFEWISIRKSFLLLAWFFLVSLVMGGAVLAWRNFWQVFHPAEFISVNRGYSWEELIGGGVVVCILIVGLIWMRLLQTTSRGAKDIYTIRIGWGENYVEIKALLDTGNGLYSMEGQRPVILVEKEIVERIVGQKVVRFFRETEVSSWVSELERCEDQEWLKRVCIIPCKTIGASHMILGFQPDSIFIANPEFVPYKGEVVIGIVVERLSSLGEYNGLLHPAVMEAMVGRSEQICA